MSSNRRLLNELRINAPIEVVWSAMTDPVQIRQWFGWEYEGLDDEIKQIFGDGVTADSTMHTLSWSTGDEMILRSAGSSTVMQTFRPVADVDTMREQAEDIDEGWIAFTEQLRFWLERHPGAERATIYLSGAARAHNASVSEAFGLAVNVAVGDRYEATAATGEALAGAVWSRLGNVSILTVDAYGDGLLAITDHDAQRQEPNGGGMLTITTYGLTQQQMEDLKSRWVRVWESKYEPSSDWGAATSS